MAHQSKDKVSGYLQVPNASKTIVVLGHGAGAGMMHRNMEGIASGLHAYSIATLRYQFPFMERGGGRDSKEVSLSTVQSAVAQAKKLQPKLTIFAAGHSFGGRMTSTAASESMLPDVKGLIFFAFPLHASGKPSVDRAEHLYAIKKTPMLFLSGTRDQLLDLDLFKPIVKKLGRQAKLHLIDTADHGYRILKRTRTSEETPFEEMCRVAGGWISKKS